MKLRRRALMLVPLVAIACGDQPKDVPPPAKAASAAPASQGELPAGHPPVDAAADPHAGHDHGTATDPGQPIAGTVEASAKVKDKLAGAQALFVIARKAGTRDILAVRRLDGNVPQSFTISGADAMVAGTPFEGTIDLTARLSMKGDAMPGPGDIEGVKTGVATGTSGVTIVLETIRP